VTDRNSDGAGRPTKPGVSGAGEAAMGVLEPSHAAIRSRLSEYLDGSLIESEQHDIRRHLDECDGCRAFWRTLLKVIDETGRLQPHRMSPDSSERLLQQLANGSARRVGT
jgi:anti-sigma factor RsiW